MALPPPPPRVLLLEDDPDVGAVLEQQLADMGCVVVDTLHTAARRFKDCDVALLDINIAGQTSFAFAREIMKRHIRVVFTSGFLYELPEDLKGCQVLEKPITRRMLEDVIQPV